MTLNCCLNSFYNMILHIPHSLITYLKFLLLLSFSIKTKFFRYFTTNNLHLSVFLFRMYLLQ